MLSLGWRAGLVHVPCSVLDCGAPMSSYPANRSRKVRCMPGSKFEAGSKMFTTCIASYHAYEYMLPYAV